jgi:hypothetical protein
MPRNRLRRIFWIGAAVLLVAAALVAIAALVAGNFDETDGKILLTLGTLFLCGAVALAGTQLVEDRTQPAVGAALAASAVPGFGLLALAIWWDGGANLVNVALTTTIVLAVELVAASQRLLLRNLRLLPLVAGTGAALAVAGALTIVAIWSDPGPGLGKAIGVLWILAGAGWLLTPVLQRWSAVGERATGVRVLAALGDVELVASHEQIAGVAVGAKPAAGEGLFLRRRQAGTNEQAGSSASGSPDEA